MRQHCAPYIRSEGSHRKSVEVYALSLKSWDISLALNMTRLTWGSVGKADDMGSHVILSVAKYPTTKVKSTYTRQFFGGILHF